MSEEEQFGEESTSEADAPEADAPEADAPESPASRPEERPPFRSKNIIAMALLATAALTALDLGTKQWALDNLSEPRLANPPALCEPDDRGFIRYQRYEAPPVDIIDGNLQLRYAENCGAAFGLMRNAPPLARGAVFGAAALLATLGLGWLFVTGRGGIWFAWAVPFIVSGAVGNLADRARLGYVVDFIRFYWSEPIPYLGTQWPTFNVADITITIGLVCLLIDGWRDPAKDGKADETPSSSEDGAEAATA